MDRPITRIVENLNPLDTDWLLGASEASNLFQKTRIIDALTSRYNPNSGWQVVDGSIGNYSANPNDKIYVPDSGTAFDISLDSITNFGDTITIYSEIENVELKKGSQTLFTINPGVVSYYLYLGNVWRDFSETVSQTSGFFIFTGKPVINKHPRIIHHNPYFVNEIRKGIPIQAAIPRSNQNGYWRLTCYGRGVPNS